jgi:hypothetical protein
MMKYIHIYGSQSSLLRFLPFRGGFGLVHSQNKMEYLFIE